MNQLTTVIIADNTDEFCTSLSAALQQAGGFQVLGTANDVQGNGFIWKLKDAKAAGAYAISELVEGKMPQWQSLIDKANGVVAE